MLLEQGAPLTLGHTTPHTELDPVVEGIGATFRDHRAVPTDHCGLALGGPANEQFVRVCTPATSLGYPRDAGLGLCTLDWGLDNCCACPARRGPST
jgi:hypothetical protein